ncbi:hypothetical protein EJ08DRAFT_138217 [Tothia fuscella]|uniref:IPT/TIG domain-containing protein n=1 Tax=Tothia fuscella TaxID=1048955 RepID=A0A9P4U006_9PEZI|nr:hypothetical protein EJ08DRAFT_138217 [Tothia fuscella]
MDSRKFYATPPTNPGPDANLFNFDTLDDGPFNANEGTNSAYDYNEFINAEFTSSPMSSNAQLNFGSPGPLFGLGKVEHNSPLSQIKPRSAVSSTSPDSSTQDSSSDSSGRRKRKSPSSSSPTAMFGSHPSQPTSTWASGDGMDADRKHRRTKQDSPVRLADYSRGDESNININGLQAFNITSASNSPPGLVEGPNGLWDNSTAESLSDSAPTIVVRARTPTAFTFSGSDRDNTPLSAYFESNQTPYLAMRDSPDGDLLPFPARNNFADVNNFSSMFAPHPLAGVGSNTIDIGSSRTRLHVSPLGHKSRVETQIPIKLTLDPIPFGIKKMHLPTETIAKSKFLAKETPRSPDTLELSAMLVCTSAMEIPENKKRALQIARDRVVVGDKTRRSSTGDTKEELDLDPSNPDAPCNGGPVKICPNCVQREKKRAGRKKAKKQDDEERWYEFERDRIVMFNTQEYLDFHEVSPVKEAQYNDPITFSPSALQVDAPMRIVCYCRHQREKIGFQVIFTVKDYRGQVIAQVMTQSILITDDHKTHTQGLSASGPSNNENGNFAVPQFMGSSAIQPHGLPGRAYHSSTNLAGMGQSHFWGTMSSGNLGQSSMTPRHLSRPASPSGHTGPKKKRKGSSGQHKLPPGLQMTRADLQPLSIPLGQTSAASGNSVLSSDAGLVSFDTGPQFGQMNVQGHYNTNPPTPSATMPPTTRDSGIGSSQGYFFSAPSSAHASRAASPTTFARINNFNGQQQQMQSVSNTTFNAMSFSPEEPPQNNPTILKVRPDHGSITGNIEVCILGKNFHRNLEVKFGDVAATTTTFWSADTLVCLLPPSVRPGPVSVSCIDQGRQSYSPPSASNPIFTYIDDTKQQLFEMAVRLQCNAQMGPGTDHWNYAHSLIAAHGQQGGFINGQASSFGGGNMLSTLSGEDIMMDMINKIDLIDSPYKPRFDMQRENGATMLSRASALGYEKLVAGLLARGASPDIADCGGYTPLMFAAINGHTVVVRRLILRGADSALRTLGGRTASELARSPEVAQSLRHVRHHFRSVSAGTPYFRSRANSAASTRSLWGPPSSGASSTMFSTDDESALDSSDDDGVEVIPSRMVSRRPSAALVAALRSRRSSNTLEAQDAPLLVPAPADGGYGYTTYANYAAMLSTFRDQLTAQINSLPQVSLPQTANWRTLPHMDFWPDQDFPAIGRRISSLVPTLGNRADPTVVTDPVAADAPPPYHEACPRGANNDFDTKPPEIFASGAESSRTASVVTLRPVRSATETSGHRERTISARGVTIGKQMPTGEEAAELRRLREEKLTPAKYDRKLWTVWVPLLIILLIWWSSGLKLPPFLSWLKNWGETVTETMTTTVVPSVPTRLRNIVT